MNKEPDVHKMIEIFLEEYGVPESLISDVAMAYMGGELKKKSKTVVISCSWIGIDCKITLGIGYLQVWRTRWYLGPTELEAGSVLIAKVLTRSGEIVRRNTFRHLTETELESKEVQVEQVSFDDNVQKVVQKKQLRKPEMGRSWVDQQYGKLREPEMGRSSVDQQYGKTSCVRRIDDHQVGPYCPMIMVF